MAGIWQRDRRALEKNLSRICPGSAPLRPATSGTNCAGSAWSSSGDTILVRREPCQVLVFSGCNSHPATGSLQPVAIGAAVEPFVPPSAAPSRPVNSGLGDLVLIATCLYSGVW